MKSFKEFFNQQMASFESDPNWGDVWPNLLRYYRGNVQQANLAIQNAQQKFGSPQAAKPQIMRMLSSITPTGV